MALITCPECGKKVSDLAKTCPDCGYPIAAMNPAGTVMIKFANGIFGKQTLYRTSDSKILWQGKAGQVATFDVSEETEIGLCYGLGKPGRDCVATVKVRGGDKFYYGRQQGALITTFGFNKVDVIDSEK